MICPTPEEIAICLTSYGPGMEFLWDGIIRLDPNSLFIFERGYLAHQQGRYQDASIFVLHGEKPVALLPLVRSGEDWVSYPGLPFGGLLGLPFGRINPGSFFNQLRSLMRHCGIPRLKWTPVPWYYRNAGRENDDEALLAAGARVIDTKISCILNTQDPHPGPSRTIGKRIRRVRRAGGLRVEPIPVEILFSLVANTLLRRHDAIPLHNLAEWRDLRDRYPDRIHFLGLHDHSGRLMSGVLGFQFPCVLRIQALGYREDKESAGWMAALYHCLCEDPRFAGLRLDLGTSMEAHTGRPNLDLLRYKQSIGGRPVSIPTYELNSQE